MSLLAKVENAVSALSRKAESAAEVAAKAAENPLEQAQALGASMQEDVLEAGKSGAESALQKLFGRTVELQAQMPGYDLLSPTALAAAKARLPGLTAPQPCIHSPDGQSHEPVTVTVAGSLPQLESALEKAGWVVAKPNTAANGILSGLSMVSSLPGVSSVLNVGDPGGPMSTMLLDGKPQVLALEKNDDHHRGRDHLRVFATGQTNASGQPLWAIAATRDTAFKINTATLSASHVIDHNLDPERNQIMADLLASGEVGAWTVAKGIPTAADAQAIRQNYVTDGDVFQVTLA